MRHTRAMVRAEAQFEADSEDRRQDAERNGHNTEHGGPACRYRRVNCGTAFGHSETTRGLVKVSETYCDWCPTCGHSQNWKTVHFDTVETTARVVA